MIPESRAFLASLVQKGGWNTHISFPDDVTQVPCIVVGQVSIDRADQLHTLTVPVWVIGRSVGNDDAQMELDEVTERVMELLDDPQCTVQRVEPMSRFVGAQSFPAYRLDVLLGVVSC